MIIMNWFFDDLKRQKFIEKRVNRFNFSFKNELSKMNKINRRLEALILRG